MSEETIDAVFEDEQEDQHFDFSSALEGQPIIEELVDGEYNVEITSAELRTGRSEGVKFICLTLVPLDNSPSGNMYECLYPTVFLPRSNETDKRRLARTATNIQSFAKCFGLTLGADTDVSTDFVGMQGCVRVRRRYDDYSKKIQPVVVSWIS